MAELSALYASALFDLAMEGDANGANLDELLEQAIFLRDLLKDAENERYFVHPHISTADKREFFSKALNAHIREDLLGLLMLTMEKNRESYFVPAMTRLIGLIKDYKGITTASVISATQLSEDQLNTLKGTLERKLKKTVEISLKVDPTVIGGMHIQVDGYFTDRTVKMRLHDLAAKMKEGCSA